MAYPAKDPETAIADVLVAASLSIAGSAAAKGTNLFGSPEVPTTKGAPINAVFVSATGGPAPQPYLGVDEDYRELAVQVMTRDVDRRRGQQTARDAWEDIHRATVSGYVSIVCLQSDPVYAGRDDLERHMFTFDVLCSFKG